MGKELLNTFKELLLKDLCGRLPYGVKVDSVFIDPDTKKHISCGIEVFTATNILMIRDGLGEFKPYLFPISSMTDEQKQYLKNRFCYDWNNEPYDLWICQIEIGDIDELIDWFHKNHIDYRCLIPMGLANDATGLNIY